MSEKSPHRRGDAARHFISGLGSGVASAVILQPLDLLKTRVQQSGNSSLTASLREITRSQNLLRSLWRGTIPSTLRTGFGSALYFSTLNAIRQNMRQLQAVKTPQNQSVQGSSALPRLSNTANLISGAVARTLAGGLLMPLTILKVRFESSFYSYPSIYDAAMDIGRREGLRGFFSGFGATALRDAPYAGTYVLMYEWLKIRLASFVADEALPSAQGPQNMQGILAGSVNFTSGVVSGAVCSALSNPFDAVKTRIQLQPHIYRNLWQTGTKMIREDGVKSLLDGLALRMSRKAISSALAWTVYEELIRRFNAIQLLEIPKL